MEQLDQLATALAEAQAKFPAVPKTGKNPHLKNEYATLDDIISAVRGPLGAHGLSFVQLLGSNGDGVTLRTILLHKSGQSLESTVVVDAGEGNRGINALQALGSAITYMKRYSLAAMLGISTDGDTDGTGAPETAGRPPTRKQASQSESAGDRPISPDKLLPGLRHKAGWFKESDGYKRNVASEPITEKQIGMVAGRIEALFPNVDAEMKTKGRHDVMRFLFGVTSAKDLTKREASALIDWTEDQDAARQEAAQILMALAVEAGQQELPL